MLLLDADLDVGTVAARYICLASRRLRRRLTGGVGADNLLAVLKNAVGLDAEPQVLSVGILTRGIEVAARRVEILNRVAQSLLFQRSITREEMELAMTFVGAARPQTALKML